MELEKKMSDLGELVAAFKKSNDEELKALKEKGTVAQEVKNKTEELNTKISEMQDEIKAIKTAANRTAQGGDEGKDGKGSEYKSVFDSYVRKGYEPTQAELKAMSVDSDVDGGYLVTPEMSSEIVKKIFESSPIRQLASVQTISSDSLELLEDLDEAGCGWVGENSARPETSTPQLKKISIPVHEMYANPKASQKILDDAAINIESYISEKVSEKFGRFEATAFVAGDGANKPKGLLSYDDGTSFNQVEQVVSGSSGAITGDSLINLIYAVKEGYRKNANFLMNRLVAKELRKFKDSQGRYLWAPGLDGNTAGSILGYNIMEASDIPGTLTNGNLVMIFGDIKQAYQIVDRIGIRVLRDPYTAKPHVMFYTTKRVGGAVKNFEAYKILKVGT